MRDAPRGAEGCTTPRFAPDRKGAECSERLADAGSRAGPAGNESRAETRRQARAEGARRGGSRSLAPETRDMGPALPARRRRVGG